MTLAREAYDALEDIVGPDNISMEPAILDTYAYQWVAELITPNKSKFAARPAAVILPGSTEEVQAVVKMCNRYRVKFKPYSTGWGVWGGTTTEGIIQLDLRRMDRILEIDEKNMFAVVEPYVIGATLQAEAMKVGLNCHMIGAGASCSLLAAATSFMGNGPDSISMGMATENLLGAEWVMPTGDILRTGSLGSGDGWFCGEGLGPSVRGLCRGMLGAWGGLGVHTKCALRLHNWPGPAVMPVEGVVPGYSSPLPDTFKAYTLAFPTWQAYAEAYYKIFDAEIGYILHRQYNKFGEDLQAAMVKIISDSTKSLDDLEKLLQTPEIKKLTEEMRRSFQIVLVGNSKGDMEYQEKALAEILAETGGVNVAAMSDPAMQKYSLLYLIKLCFKNLNFVYSGGHHHCFTHKGPPDFLVSQIPEAEKLLKKHQKTGLLVDSGADTMMGGAAFLGGGGITWFEQFLFYDPHDKESCKEAVALVVEEGKIFAEKKWPGPITGTGSEEEAQRSMLSSNQPEIYRWQAKIKEAFDPNDVGDRTYLYLKESKNSNPASPGKGSRKKAERT